MYRKDGFAVHLLVTCIGNGGFLCGFGGVYVNPFIFNDMTICIYDFVHYLCSNKKMTNYSGSL
jgi:hypothetical protein